MSAQPVSSASGMCSQSASTLANGWLLDHHAELASRSRAVFSDLDPERREEMIAESMALILAWAISAARRGKLRRMTPFWAVVYAARQVSSGRRFAGTNGNCVMSEIARARGRVRVCSLEDPIGDNQDKPLTLRESLAGRDGDNPYHIVRRENDYNDILTMERVSAKGRRTLEFLAESKSEGRQSDLADELGVTDGRVSQLKGELRSALGRHGYAGPLGRRPSACAGQAVPA